MRKSLIVLAAVVPLLGLGVFAAAAVPALADNDDDDLCISAPALLPSGPIDLEAIPPQQVTGPLSVRRAGLGCDDDDDDHGGGSWGHDDDDDHGDGSRGHDDDDGEDEDED